MAILSWNDLPRAISLATREHAVTAKAHYYRPYLYPEAGKDKTSDLHPSKLRSVLVSVWRDGFTKHLTASLSYGEALKLRNDIDVALAQWRDDISRD